MTGKRMMTALALLCCLALTATALATGAPASQFGWSGWYYRQSTSCGTAATEAPTAPPVTATPEAPRTPAPTAEPTREPSSSPTAEPTREPSPSPTAEPTREPSPAPTAEPTQAPTAEPVATPTARPTATPKPTEKPTPTPLAPSTTDDYTTGSITTQEEIGFLLLNQDRAANGRAALVLDPELCRLARLKSRDMFLNRYFAHNSPTYGSAAQMLTRFGYVFTSVAENIAHHATVEKAQAAFMSSDGHRRNSLGSQWKKVGIGVCEDAQGFVYVTQLFVR